MTDASHWVQCTIVKTTGGWVDFVVRRDVIDSSLDAIVNSDFGEMRPHYML